jgi:cytochrome c oxidase subunit II
MERTPPTAPPRKVEVADRKPSRRSMIGTLVAAVVAVGIGIVLSYTIRWFPVAASTQAKRTDTLYHVLVIATIPIFVLVTTVVLYCAWQFHLKPGEELKDGPPIHGNTRLEVAWTALPAILLLGMVAYSFVVLHQNEEKPKGVPEVQIDVTGQQFFWSYEYPPSVTGGPTLKSTKLYLPDGYTVFFNMRSRDVIHAFFIPAFRLQEDVVPGITTHYRATLDRLGSYPVVCNLLCGVGHSLMRSTVHVVPPAQFEAWIRSQVSATGGGGPPPVAASGGSAG